MNTRAYTSRKLRTFVVAIGCAAALIVVSVPASGNDVIMSRQRSWHFNYIEDCMMRKINHTRMRHGLHALRADRQIGYVARRHAQKMAASRAVFHDADLGSEVTHWRLLGQNSGAAGGCKRLFRAFMHSAEHRANILGHWRFFGLGVQWGGHRLYAQQVFEARRDPGNVYHYP
ncbi:MAG TPA: CAP domain-containing protein [Actinomycetota bacterium]|nr:CAP domain-containing protein [Actinomycetota bacterium]